MNDLIKIENVDGQLVVSSKTVAEELGKRHDHIIRDLEKILTDPNVGALIIPSEYKDKKGELRKQYLLTKDGFTLYMFNIQGYNDMKLAYINKFNEMERTLKGQQKLPSDYLEALKELVHKEEKLREAQKTLEYQKPKVLFAEAVETSNTSILVGDLAKILKQNGIDVGGKRLFSWLRENGYLMKKDKDNMPTQYSMELGLFEIKETVINHSDGHIQIRKTPKVTGKGQIYFINKFKKLVA